MQGQKHLIKCRCVLTQFRKLQSPPQHQFVVFSVIDDEGNVIPKHVVCNNCGIVHRVTDICVSEILNKEDAPILTIDDIKISLREDLVKILEHYNVDLATWEAVQFIIEQKQWGQFVVLERDDLEKNVVGKYLVILGESLYKINQFERKGVV